MKGPWTFLLLAAGVVLLAGDYFPGDNIVGVLAILSGICRFIMQAIATAAMAAIQSKINDGKLHYDGEKRQWLPPAPPKRYTR